MNKRFIAMGMLALVPLVLAVWFSSREPKPDAAQSPARSFVGAQSGAGAAASAPARFTDTAPPPWAANRAAAPALPGTANPLAGASVPLDKAPSKDGERDLKELERMQSELATSVRDGKQPDHKKVADLLNKVKQMRGPVVGGVNLDAVLNNLEKAGEMQTLALEMQRESAKPGGPDRKALLANVEKLKKLQSEIRNDISVPQAPVAGAAK